MLDNKKFLGEKFNLDDLTKKLFILDYYIFIRKWGNRFDNRFPTFFLFSPATRCSEWTKPWNQIPKIGKRFYNLTGSNTLVTGRKEVRISNWDKTKFYLAHSWFLFYLYLLLIPLRSTTFIRSFSIKKKKKEKEKIIISFDTREIIIRTIFPSLFSFIVKH